MAEAIAETLQAKLTGPEVKAIAEKPTNNSEAYDAYLRGLAYTLKTEKLTGQCPWRRRDISPKRCDWIRSSLLVGRCSLTPMRLATSP